MMDINPLQQLYLGQNIDPAVQAGQMLLPQGAPQAMVTPQPNQAGWQGLQRLAKIDQEQPGYLDYGNGVAQGGPAIAAGNWRSRATPVQSAPQVRAIDAPITQPVIDIAQPSAPAANNDWRARATPVQQPTQQAQPVQTGQDMGRTGAAVQGFNSAIPFGERIAAGIGAPIAYGADQMFGEGDTSLGDFYKIGRENQAATRAEHPGYYAGGALTGIAATLPAVSAKVIGGGAAATNGIRGGINAIPEMLSSVGNYVRGGKVASDAGRIAKVASGAGKAARSAVVAAPAGAAYGYGASENDLNSEGALQDATSGAKLGAVAGGALSGAGSALGAVAKPAIAEATKVLAKRAKEFGIDLSLNQIAPGTVRDTVQKVSQTIPGSGVDAFNAKQVKQWHMAVAKEIGQDADNLGPEVITKFLDESSDKFDNVLKGKTIKVDYSPLKKITNILTESQGNITKDYADIVAGKAENLTKQLFNKRQLPNSVAYSPKQLSGEKLASIRSQLVKNLPNVAGDAKEYVGKLIDVVDDIAKSNLPKDALEELNIVRRQWRNFKTLEPLLEKSTDGTINPTQLMQRVASSKYIKSSRKAVGEDNLVDLARIGKEFLPKLGGSDTAQKVAYMKGAAAMGSGALGWVAPFKVVPALLANRGYQKLVNQSPALVKKAVGGASNSKALPIADMLAAGNSPKISKRTEAVVHGYGKK